MIEKMEVNHLWVIDVWEIDNFQFDVAEISVVKYKSRKILCKAK